MKKINCVLLVDDSASTNFYNKKIIETSGKVEHIFEVANGLEALEFIHQKGRFNHYPSPDIIFLDINMPKMDGFEFLEQYAKLAKQKTAHSIIVFLTTSNWSKDKMKAAENDLIHGFIEKPLKEKDLKKLCNYYHNNDTHLYNLI